MSSIILLVLTIVIYKLKTNFKQILNFTAILDDELLDPHSKLENLLYSLFHEMGVIIYDYLPFLNKCRCSREKAVEVISSLGARDAFALLVENKIDINCQFCNQSQIFNRHDLEEIFHK